MESITKKLGDWNVIYKRFSRCTNTELYSKFLRIFKNKTLSILEARVLRLDSTNIKVYSNACRVKKTSDEQIIGCSKCS